MIGGIVEVAENERHLSVHRGFLVVRDDAAELGRVPLDDITALVLSAHRATLSKQVMVALAERKAVVVITGRNWHPLSISLPFGEHYAQAGILHDQIEATQPLKKRLWKQLVASKIQHQRATLALCSPGSDKVSEMDQLSKRVKSGDPDNVEAQAARLYWQALMGPDFRRDRDLSDSNTLLNYGYMVLRAAMARTAVAHGLNPSLGLHHRSRGNAFQLVDDLVEPFRAQVDLSVHEIVRTSEDGDLSLTPDLKHTLAAVLQQDMQSDRGASPVIGCMARLAQSLVTILNEKKGDLALPDPPPLGKLL